MKWLKEMFGIHLTWEEIDMLKKIERGESTLTSEERANAERKGRERFLARKETLRKMNKEERKRRHIDFLKSKPLSQLTVAEAEELGMVKLSV